MTLRHYGGSTPAGPGEWTCPSCQAVNTVPLKAGCQSCGAGADARKVGGLAPETLVMIAEEQREDAKRAESAVAGQSFAAWYATSSLVLSGVPYEALKEAFMAGVAWAQAQANHLHAPDRVLLTPEEAVGMPGEPVTSPVTLWTDDGKHQDKVDDQTLLTILAALGFYRDNVLNYNTVEGQLSSQQVTDLIQRLLPQEQEP